MGKPLILVVSLWVDPSRLEDYAAYEREASGVMAKHGGRIERVIRVEPRQSPRESPFEIHIVYFPDEEAFDRYRSDPESQRLSVRRREVIERTVVEKGRDVQVYVPTVPSHEAIPEHGLQQHTPEPRLSRRSSEAVLERARDEAVRLGHQYVGTEHQLLGLLLLNDADVAAVLAAAHLKPERIKEAIESTVFPGTPDAEFDFELPLTSRAKKVLRFAEEARDLDGSSEVLAIHILRGILKEELNVAAQILRQLGVSE